MGSNLSGTGAFGQFMPLILIFVIFYFLLIRPQQKKAKAHKLLLEGLQKDDKVITSSGIFGTVVSLDKDTIVVEIAERTRIKMLRGNIAEKVGANESSVAEKKS